jgi:hypothetical protein
MYVNAATSAWGSRDSSDDVPVVPYLQFLIKLVGKNLC